MKEISEINKRINDSAPVGEPAPPPKPKYTGPAMRSTPGGGFHWVNTDLIS